MEPRLSSLLISDFRSIQGEWTVPLDAGVVLLHGLNGAGKSSVLSALELACTGTIAHLDRSGDQTYRRHLQHKGVSSGRIELTATGLNASGATVTVSAQGIAATPLLDGTLAETFTERCFLPQATLSRLLEFYAPRESQDAESSLIRFVKEMLGLDHLDFLIDGLYSSGHLARVKKASSSWRVADQLLIERQRTLADSTNRQAAARRELASAMAELRGAAHEYGVSAVEPGVELATAVGPALAAGSDDATWQGALREAGLRLDAIEAALPEADVVQNPAVEAGPEAALSAAVASYEHWLTIEGKDLLDWSQSALRAEGRAVTRLDASTALVTLTEGIDRTQSALRGLREQLVDRQRLVGELNAARSQAETAEGRAAEIASRRAQVASGSTAASLSALLSSLADHVEGNVCPACDRPFSADMSLVEHIRSKALRLTSDAAALMALDKEYSSTVAEADGLRRSAAALTSRLALVPDESGIVSDIASRARALDGLNSLVTSGELGRELQRRLADAQSAVASRRRSDAIRERLVSELRDVSVVLGVQLTNAALDQQVASLRGFVGRSLAEAASREQLRARLRASLARVLAAESGLSEMAAATAASERAATLIEAQIREATRRKEVASTLKKQAETLRSATVSRVFDERLNASWAQVFRALVPSEPFAPRFRPPAGASRVAKIELETVDRDGVPAASPAAMLSQGNLNTAALSLFTALHFAAPPRLPWLIFDDPVQSMDDLHVANFAALVKHLTRVNGRQVVLAVHQRELFDYLALELTPATPGEQLLAIELERSRGSTRVSYDRREYTPDQAVVPLTAA